MRAAQSLERPIELVGIREGEIFDAVDSRPPEELSVIPADPLEREKTDLGLDLSKL